MASSHKKTDEEYRVLAEEAYSNLIAAETKEYEPTSELADLEAVVKQQLVVIKNNLENKLSAEELKQLQEQIEKEVKQTVETFKQDIFNVKFVVNDSIRINQNEINKFKEAKKEIYLQKYILAKKAELIYENQLKNLLQARLESALIDYASKQKNLNELNKSLAGIASLTRENNELKIAWDAKADNIQDIVDRVNDVFQKFPKIKGTVWDSDHALSVKLKEVIDILIRGRKGIQVVSHQDTYKLDAEGIFQRILQDKMELKTLEKEYKDRLDNIKTQTEGAKKKFDELQKVTAEKLKVINNKITEENQIKLARREAITAFNKLAEKIDEKIGVLSKFSQELKALNSEKQALLGLKKEIDESRELLSKATHLNQINAAKDNLAEFKQKFKLIADRVMKMTDYYNAIDEAKEEYNRVRQEFDGTIKTLTENTLGFFDKQNSDACKTTLQNVVRAKPLQNFVYADNFDGLAKQADGIKRHNEECQRLIKYSQQIYSQFEVKDQNSKMLEDRKKMSEEQQQKIAEVEQKMREKQQQNASKQQNRAEEKTKAKQIQEMKEAEIQRELKQKRVKYTPPARLSLRDQHAEIELRKAQQKTENSIFKISQEISKNLKKISENIDPEDIEQAKKDLGITGFMNACHELKENINQKNLSITLQKLNEMNTRIKVDSNKINNFTHSLRLELQTPKIKEQIKILQNNLMEQKEILLAAPAANWLVKTIEDAKKTYEQQKNSGFLSFLSTHKKDFAELAKVTKQLTNLHQDNSSKLFLEIIKKIEEAFDRAQQKWQNKNSKDSFIEHLNNDKGSDYTRLLATILKSAYNYCVDGHSLIPSDDKRSERKSLLANLSKNYNLDEAPKSEVEMAAFRGTVHPTPSLVQEQRERVSPPLVETSPETNRTPPKPRSP